MMMRATSPSTSRRDFLRTSAAALGGLALAPYGAASAFAQQVANIGRNWAGNLAYSAAVLHKPTTVTQVQELIRAGNRPKALGSRHSFSEIADTTGELISTEKLNKVLEIDPETLRVRVGGGIRYGNFCELLHREGLGLPNLASLPHISVAGAASTGTHGSGDKLGNLATDIVALELVTPEGEIVRLSRESDADFLGAVVGLGALGVVTEVTLQAVPTYDVQQFVYLDLPVAELEEHFDEIMGAAYSVSLFTDWQKPTVNQVWLKHKVVDGKHIRMPARWFGGTLAPRHVHPIISLSATPCTPQMGVPGPWFARIPHFVMGFTPSSGKELQAEYFVPRRHAVAAIKAYYGLAEVLGPVLQISEIRSIKGDELWMSPAYGEDYVSLHCTFTDNGPGVMAVLPLLQKALAPLEARPHWAKLSTIDSRTLQDRYPKMDDFKALMKKYDPDGRLRNDYLNTYLFDV